VFPRVPKSHKLGAVWESHDKSPAFLGRPLGPPYATEPLTFLSVCNVDVLWPNGWMDQDATWYRGRLQPRRHCVRWGPSSPPMERAQHPHFSVHVCCGQMVAHLSSCWTVVSNVVVKKQAWIKQFLWHNLPEECMHICGLVSALVRFISSTVLCFANKITSRKATGSVVIFCYLYCWKVLKFVIWYVNPVWVIADDFR